MLTTLVKCQLKAPVLWEGSPASWIRPFGRVTLGGASARPPQERREAAGLKWELGSRAVPVPLAVPAHTPARSRTLAFPWSAWVPGLALKKQQRECFLLV